MQYDVKCIVIGSSLQKTDNSDTHNYSVFAILEALKEAMFAQRGHIHGVTGRPHGRH